MQMTQTKCGLASIYNLKFIYQMEDSKLLTIVASHTHIDYNHIENTILIKKIIISLGPHQYSIYFIRRCHIFYGISGN